jgi:hypothetical protein
MLTRKVASAGPAVERDAGQVVEQGAKIGV